MATIKIGRCKVKVTPWKGVSVVEIVSNFYINKEQEKPYEMHLLSVTLSEKHA